MQNQLQIIKKLFTKVNFFEEMLKFNFTLAEEKEGFQNNRELFEIFIAIAKVRGLPLTYKMKKNFVSIYTCLLYTSDAADERSSVDLGGRRIIKKKKKYKKKKK